MKIISQKQINMVARMLMLYCEELQFSRTYFIIEGNRVAIGCAAFPQSYWIRHNVTIEKTRFRYLRKKWFEFVKWYKKNRS